MMWRMSGPNLDAATGLGRSEVQIVEATLNKSSDALTITPVGTNLYELERQ